MAEFKSLDQAKQALRRAESALQRALLREREIIETEHRRTAELAHEVRTPLNALIGYAHMLAEQVHGPLGAPEYEAYSRTVYHAALHLRDICDSIPKGSAPDGSETPEPPEAPATIDMADVDASELIESIVELFSGMAKERGVNLAAHIEADFPAMRTDPRRLNQIIINLVSNAIKFTPRGGNVNVEAVHDPSDGAMIFVISDTGKGIPAKDLKDKLGAYPKAGTTSPHGDEGSGLGLNISGKLANELRGVLLMSSQENVGTVVAVRLPVDFDRPTALSEGRRTALEFIPHISPLAKESRHGSGH